MRTAVRKGLLLPVLVIGALFVPLASEAGQLPSNCTKTQGQVICSTFERARQQPGRGRDDDDHRHPGEHEELLPHAAGHRDDDEVQAAFVAGHALLPVVR